MGDSLRVGKLSHYITSQYHPGQLSLAIPPWVGTMTTGDGAMVTATEKASSV